MLSLIYLKLNVRSGRKANDKNRVGELQKLDGQFWIRQIELGSARCLESLLRN